jgi:beta-N-acetylhexosaminidase
VKEAGKLDVALGQLIIGKVPGYELDEESRHLLASGYMCGVTLFKENAANLEQLQQLISQIKRLAHGCAVIAVDQEGGAVQRFEHLLTPLPSAMALAASQNPQLVAEITSINSRQLKLLGVNCLLAPVLDIASQPLNPVIATRAYSSAPEVVAELAALAAQSITENGLLAVGKHFPGHGDTVEDSHTQLAVSKADAKTLWQRELLPFRLDNKELPAILTAHVWLPDIDSDPLPASLSGNVSHKLLREYLGFNGLAMTDDLLMKAVADRYGIGQAAVLAVLAGNDQVLVCGSAADIKETHQALAAAVKSGQITEQRLQQSLKRIALAYGKLNPAFNDQPQNLQTLKQELSESKQKALSASISAISILRGRLPAITSGQWVLLSPDHRRYKLNLGPYLQAAWQKLQPPVELVEKRYPLDPNESQCREIADFVSARNCIYMTYRTLLNRGQIQLGRALAARMSTGVNIACDTPYDLVGLPHWDNCLASYDPSDLAMEALSMVLSGQAAAAGNCPVSLQIEL